jgi:hypothetical protein
MESAMITLLAVDQGSFEKMDSVQRAFVAHAIELVSAVQYGDQKIAFRHGGIPSYPTLAFTFATGDSGVQVSGEFYLRGATLLELNVVYQNYNVEVTLASGCGGTDKVFVSVLETDKMKTVVMQDFAYIILAMYAYDAAQAASIDKPES